MLKRQRSIESAMELAEARKQKRRRLDGGAGGDLDPDVLEVLYTKFIVAHHESLRLVECPEFRAFLKYLNTETDAWLPEEHSTIKTWIIRQFNAQKVLTRAVLASALSTIHISCDLWTAPNRKTYLAVTAEGVDKNGDPFHLLLALKEMKDSHAGNDQADWVLIAIKYFCIEKKLGYFVMDNDSKNDTMIRHLAIGGSPTKSWPSVILAFRGVIPSHSEFSLTFH